MTISLIIQKKMCQTRNSSSDLEIDIISSIDYQIDKVEDLGL